jgi:hypothetical protein
MLISSYFKVCNLTQSFSEKNDAFLIPFIKNRNSEKLHYLNRASIYSEYV